MQRKWVILPTMTLAVIALVGGFSMADDDGPLHKLMEQVNKSNLGIKKAVRTPVAYKKAHASGEIIKHSDELIRLAKEGRGMGKEAAKKAKNIKDPDKKWVELMDAFIVETEKFSEVASKPDTNQEKAKSAFNEVGKTCTNCHNDFRVEEESF